MESKIYNQDGNEVGVVVLPEDVFGARWNPALVHQVFVSMQSNARAPVAHAKDRSEVSGGGRKPWRQKGTGRARHGSRRSPLWRHGGATFGPTRDRNFKKKINKKMRRKALYAVFSEKFRDNEILFLDSVAAPEAKARAAREMLLRLGSIPGFERLPAKRKNAVFMTLPARDENVYKSFRNFGNVKVGEFRNANLVDILNYKYLVVTNPEESLRFFTKS